MSEYEKAKQSYKLLIKYYSRSKEAETASILLSFLSTIDESIKTIFPEIAESGPDKTIKHNNWFIHCAFPSLTFPKSVP